MNANNYYFIFTVFCCFCTNLYSKCCAVAELVVVVASAAVLFCCFFIPVVCALTHKTECVLQKKQRCAHSFSMFIVAVSVLFFRAMRCRCRSSTLNTLHK